MADSNTTLSPSNSMLVPLRRSPRQPPRRFYGGFDYSDHQELALAPTNCKSSPLVLPPGWGVEEIPRKKGRHIDRYYYEPGTGRKFRSSTEVQKYLYGKEIITRQRAMTQRKPVKRSNYRKMVVSGGKMVRIDKQPNQGEFAIVPYSNSAPTAPHILPDGWVVEKIPRVSGGHDKYYYEPGTGKKFRSMVSVERYLAEYEDDTTLSKALVEIKENQPLAKVFKLSNHIKRNKNVAGENKKASSFVDFPMKVNWVLDSPTGNVWKPFISEMSVPDSVKEQWNKQFTALMKDGNCDSGNACEQSLQLAEAPQGCSN